MKQIRIALVVTNFPQISETFIVSKFLGLLGRGWDVHINCQLIDQESWLAFPQLDHAASTKRQIHRAWPHQPHWLAALLLLPGLVFCLFTRPRSTWQYFKLGWCHFRWRIFRQFYLDIPLIRLQPSILHFEFGALAVDRTYLKDCLGTKLSVSFRGYDLNYIGLDQPNYYQNLWGKIDGAHFLGEDLWNRALKRGAPENLNRTIIPPAINFEKFPEKIISSYGKLGTQEHPLRIVSVGRLHWKKGYEFSLQAVKHLCDQGFNCEYKVIGQGEYNVALYYARYQMGLENVVEFLGSLPPEQVINYLKWADVFLHGAVSEGFCNAVLEAQAIGKPVIASDADGLRENIQDGVTGFIVPRRDPGAMAEKLVLLANDGNLRQRMGAAGRQRVEQHFQLKQQLDAFEKFYENL
jgi:colanic acid/amylovoran biosynthesis glycosyltransferase